MSKHTPGPWMAHNGGIYQARQEGENLYAEMAVAGVFAEEDIPLIAAAPELLEVAQSILADDLLQYLPAEYVAKVRSVISKATGSES